MNIQQNIFNASAARVAKGDMDLAKETVEETVSKKGFEANAVAVKTQDETTKSLLDIKA
jgi:flagellar hook protein FlgE